MRPERRKTGKANGTVNIAGTAHYHTTGTRKRMTGV